MNINPTKSDEWWPFKAEGLNKAYGKFHMPANTPIPEPLEAWARQVYKEFSDIKDENSRAPFQNFFYTKQQDAFRIGVHKARATGVSLGAALCAPQGPDRKSILDLVIEKKLFTLVIMKGYRDEPFVVDSGQIVLGPRFVQKTQGGQTIGLAVLDCGHYAGEMKHGLPHGKGHLHLGTAEVFEGNFCEGLRHGDGLYFVAKDLVSGRLSSVSEQVWNRGEMVSDKVSFFRQSDQGRISFWKGLSDFFGIGFDSGSEKPKNQ